MDSLAVPILLVATWLVAVLLVMTAGTSQLRKGQWRVHRSGTGLVWFDSDFGRFALDHSGHLCVQSWQADERRIPLGDVVAIRFSYGQYESPEMVREFGPMPTNRPYLDVVDRYDVSLVCRDGDVPVFVAGQVFRRTPGLGWVSHRVTSLLAGWGLVPDVQAHARSVVDELRDEFARRGHPLRLA